MFWEVQRSARLDEDGPPHPAPHQEWTTSGECPGPRTASCPASAPLLPCSLAGPIDLPSTSICPVGTLEQKAQNPIRLLSLCQYYAKLLGRQTDTITNWAGSSGQEIPELTCLRGGGPPERTASRCIQDPLPPVLTAAGLSGGRGCGLDAGHSGTGKRWASRSKQAAVPSLPPDKRSRFGPLLLAQWI